MKGRIKGDAMEKEKITQLKKNFDDYVHQTEDGTEYWLARELQKLLGYVEWRKFEGAIKRAIEACRKSGFEASNHFVETAKTIKMPKNATKNIVEYMLTRYACYLICQNGDPSKEEIAFAQSYFATQTRKQELIEERMQYLRRAEAREKLKASEKRLSQNIYERGVDDAGFARIRSKGDQALFGGRATQEMKDKLGIKESRPLADFLPTVTIAAKNLATEMTNYNVEQKDLYGEIPITGEHVENNRTVRKMLIERNIKPEELPASEDMKKLERRVKKSEKDLEKISGKLKNKS